MYMLYIIQDYGLVCHFYGNIKFCLNRDTPVQYVHMFVHLISQLSVYHRKTIIIYLCIYTTYNLSNRISMIHNNEVL